MTRGVRKAPLGSQLGFLAGIVRTGAVPERHTHRLPRAFNHRAPARFDHSDFDARLGRSFRIRSGVISRAPSRTGARDRSSSASDSFFIVLRVRTEIKISSSSAYGSFFR